MSHMEEQEIERPPCQDTGGQTTSQGLPTVLIAPIPERSFVSKQIRKRHIY